MKKKSKVKAAVAGAVAVATVATASVGGGNPTPAPSSAAWTDTAPGSVAWSDAVTDLQNAVNSLMSVSAAHGVELPDKPGINDLVDGLDGVAPVDGYTTYATVSSTGAVSKGDPVRYPLEPGTVTSPRSVLGSNCTILAMASGAEDWTNSQWSNDEQAKPCNLNSAYVYTSANGNTALRVMNKNGYAASDTLCAGAATSADVCVTYDGHILVAYSEGGSGVLQVYKTTAQTYGITLAETITYVWAGTGAPDNVQLTYSSVDAQVSICCTRADETGARYGAVYDLAMNVNLDDVLSDVEIKLTADACPDLWGLDPDPGAKGWDIAYVSSDDYCFNRIIVTCPIIGGGQAVIWTDRDESGATAVKGYVLSYIKGGVDAALSEVICADGPSTLLLARTVRDGDVDRVYLELLWRRRSDGKLAIVRRGYVQGSNITGDIDQLRICNHLYMSPYTSQAGASLVSWVTDGGLYAATVELSPEDGALRLSPAVRVTDTSGVGVIMERSGGTAKVVYAADTVQEGYVTLRRRVSSCTAAEADGYALADAQAGSGVYFMRTKNW